MKILDSLKIFILVLTYYLLPQVLFLYVNLNFGIMKGETFVIIVVFEVKLPGKGYSTTFISRNEKHSYIT